MNGDGHNIGTIEKVRPEDIRPSALNNELYHRFDARNDDDAALARSIAREGVKDPLIVDEEGFILSGHRRHAAAILTKTGLVPIHRRAGFRLAELPRAEQLKELAVYNRQRTKDAGEMANEEIVLADSGDAYAALRERLEERRREALIPFPDSMAIVGELKRAAISEAKRPMLDAVRAIVRNRVDYWPLSVRQIHYALLNAPPLVHASKARRYDNTPSSYKGLTNLCARARLAGLLPWEAIADETRPVELWGTHATVAAYVEREMHWFLGDYRRDLMQGQLRHVEIVCEKNTVAEIVRRVADEYTLPVTSGRGFCSVEPRRQIVERYRRSGKTGLVLILLSDADPDGEEIAQSFARSIRDDFGVEEVEAVRPALTPAQARELGLPLTIDAKKTSTNYRKFIKLYGSADAYELEALAPEQLAELLEKAIEGIIDTDAYCGEVERWQKEAGQLELVKARVKASVSANLGGLDHADA